MVRLAQIAWRGQMVCLAKSLGVAKWFVWPKLLGVAKWFVWPKLLGVAKWFVV
jgi:hypothetical protein